MKTVSPISVIETQELIQKLVDRGHGNLVACLLDNEQTVYTKKGRLNKSSTCREMKWKGKQLEDALSEMREVLKVEMDFQEDEVEI